MYTLGVSLLLRQATTQHATAVTRFDTGLGTMIEDVSRGCPVSTLHPYASRGLQKIWLTA